MKRLSFLILFLCFIAPTIYGQSIDVVKDTTYFDQDWKKTIYLEDAKYARIVKRDNQNQIVGTVRDYYLPNWILQFEGKLSGENPDVPIGKCFWFFENGKIQSSATYVDGKPSSDAIQYKEAIQNKVDTRFKDETQLKDSTQSNINTKCKDYTEATSNAHKHSKDHEHSRDHDEY